MRRLLLVFILALAATCAVSLTVPADTTRLPSLLSANPAFDRMPGPNGRG